MKKKFIIGLTGGIATGKSEVLRILVRKGVPVISSDDLARACLRQGQSVYRAVVQAFGPGIVNSQGEIDRHQLGEIVFRQPHLRRQLERLVHPYVLKGLKRFIACHSGVMILDIPLLFEKKWQRWVDQTWVITSSRKNQFERLRKRNGFSRKQSILRIKSQMPLREKVKRADVVISNDSGRQALQKQVLKFWSCLS